MKELLDSTWAIRCVWRRYFDVFRESLLYGVVTTFTEPFLYLVSFGYGMGSLIGDITVDGVTLHYRQYIFSGIIAQTVLFQGFFEAAYGSFVRMYYQRIFHAMAITPITLSEVLWGELLWDATKGAFAASAVLLIGCVMGDFKIMGTLACLPLCFVCSFLFASLGLWVSGVSRTIEQISYPQYLMIFPMFLFCGVFFPIDRLPFALQIFAWCLPLTSVNSLVRTLTLGLPFDWKAVPILATWLIVLTFVSRRAMLRRLIK